MGNTEARPIHNRLTECDRVCYFLSDKHEYKGSEYYCKYCHEHGCQNHMNLSSCSNELIGQCNKCKEIRDERMETKTRICVCNGHTYIGPAYRCYDCKKTGCEEHLAINDDDDDDKYGRCPECQDQLEKQAEDDEKKRKEEQAYEEKQTEVMERTCQLCEKSYTDRAYQCENCDRYTCKNCTLKDYFDERIKDNVFTCYKCYENDCRFQDNK